MRDPGRSIEYHLHASTFSPAFLSLVLLIKLFYNKRPSQDHDLRRALEIGGMDVRVSTVIRFGYHDHASTNTPQAEPSNCFETWDYNASLVFNETLKEAPNSALQLEGIGPVGLPLRPEMLRLSQVLHSEGNVRLQRNDCLPYVLEADCGSLV